MFAQTCQAMHLLMFKLYSCALFGAVVVADAPHTSILCCWLQVCSEESFPFGVQALMGIAAGKLLLYAARSVHCSGNLSPRLCPPSLSTKPNINRKKVDGGLRTMSRHSICFLVEQDTPLQ